MNFLLSLGLIFFPSTYYCYSYCRDGIIDFAISGKGRTDAIYWHNYYRKLIKNGDAPNHPKAAEMSDLSYDRELETEAQYFANMCHYEHQHVKTRSYGQVGINLHMKVSEKYNKRQEWAQIIYEWWMENDMFLYGKEIIPQSRHFTQMIWADTKAIGCGFSTFPFDHPNNTLYHKFYVCTYYPRGNVEGEVPYVASYINH